MAYIDETYYNDTYVGKPMPTDTFKRLSERASDVVDSIVDYQINNLSTMGTFMQDQIKKAVAAQTEYLFLQGGENVNHGTGNVTSANIGQFSYNDGNGANENLSRDAIRTSPAVIDYLKPTGLLYRGVNAYGAFYPAKFIGS